MKKSFLLTAFAALAVSASAQGNYQFVNGDFETWSNATTEPTAWHGFASAKGSLASMAAGQLGSSTEVRPGSAGNRSALIESGVVNMLFFKIVANGTMTNGQLNAGSTTAADPDNHAEMDLSSTATDKNGDPFYTKLDAAPDSISLWVKFAQNSVDSSNPYATVSIKLTDGTYYQEPAAQTYTNVAASAGSNTIAATDWMEMKQAFDYDSYASNNAQVRAIFFTASTNATPGKGNEGDKLWVDDIVLIYHAGVSSISYDGAELEGWDKNTRNYTVSIAANAVVTEDQIAATIEGRAAVLSKTLTETANGYTATVTATSADGTRVESYTIDFERQAPATGDVNGDGKVDAADVSLTINMILTGTGINLNADLNGDGVVNAADVTALINLILQ